MQIEKENVKSEKPYKIKWLILKSPHQLFLLLDASWGRALMDLQKAKEVIQKQFLTKVS